MRKKEAKRKENRWVAPGILGLLAVGAFLLRVVPQLDKVFVNGQVWFREVDVWYHMRLVDNMMVNFPIPLRYDVYASFPDGSQVGYYPMLSWIVAGAGKLGINYEVFGALLPPIIGGLILVPVYFLTRELFGRGVALVSCLLCAVLPTELLHRTLLGFTDHHMLETLFMVLAILFIILAYKYGKWGYIIGAGLSLGFYALSWTGSSFLFAILGIWFLVEFTRGNDRPYRVLLYSSLIAIAISGYQLWYGLSGRQNLAMLIAVAVIPYILVRLAGIFDRKKIIIGLYAIIGVAFIMLCLPLEGTLFYGMKMVGVRSVFWGFGSYIQEVNPTSLQVAFTCYGISFFLMLGGFYYAFKNKVNILFIVWSIFLILAVIGQRKWGYYTAIPISILSAYFMFEIGRRTSVRVAVIVVMVFFAILPNIRGTIQIVNLPNNITPDWQETCLWLKDNTPKPFINDPYYSLYTDEKASYGILNWWDYGHWIIRVGKRVPTSSPTRQAVHYPYSFFIAQSEEEANRMVEELNIRYVVVSQQEVTTKFPALVHMAGHPMEESYKYLPNSMAYRLWIEEAETWEKVYENETVKIFEKL